MKAMLSLLLSVIPAAALYAGRLDVPRQRPLQPITSPRMERLLREARAVFALRDGSIWITHPAPAESEPSALAVTRFGAGGSAKVFLISDFLPKGSIPRGWCGQVYGVALLTDGRIAISGGWTDGRQSHNAVFLLRADGASYVTERVIELAGVARITDGPDGTVAALTSGASIRGGGPLLTILLPDGAALAAYLSPLDTLTAIEAAQNARKARIQRVGERSFLLYDPSRGSILAFDLTVDISRRESTVTPIRFTFVDEDPTTADLPVMDISGAEDGDVLVIRTGRVRGRFATLLTVYGSLSSVVEEAVLENPWNHAITIADEIRGVVLRNSAHFDTVRFRRSK